MTLRKTVLLTAGLVAVFALGTITGPTIREHWSKGSAPEATVAMATPAAEPSAPAPAKAKRPAPRAKASSPRADEANASSRRADEMVAKKDAPGTVRIVAVSVWEPELRDRVKAVLNPGARLELAADGFGDTELFVAVAHAARNTNVPFVLLKDRVLNQGESLADAIHEFKPELDAKAEVSRARAAARSDLDSTS